MKKTVLNINHLQTVVVVTILKQSFACGVPEASSNEEAPHQYFLENLKEMCLLYCNMCNVKMRKYSFQDFLVILKQTLQNYYKILKKCFKSSTKHWCASHRDRVITAFCVAAYCPIFYVATQ